ncbi:MAG: pilus assembly PilX N-terminal domain-containing protein, partial [Gemmatimonadetes bacterium]|nr:pilus assembly PilX N-terminal domain-containing protein [Gemmatimonadota bacterium]
MRHEFFEHLRDRRGAALPVALMGLVAITLLVTTALFTSSTEYAISGAHRVAASSLYGADAALEQYLADRVATNQSPWLSATQAGTARGPNGTVYTVRVDRMLDQVDMTAFTRNEIFSLLVQPQNGRGRSVGAFIRTTRTADRLTTNIQAGATSGGNLSVSGNAVISDGRSGTNYCGTDSATSPYAVQVTAGSTVTLGNNAEKSIEGSTNVTSYDKEQLAQNVLGTGMTLQKLALSAQIKFGAQFGRPEYNNSTTLNSLATTDSTYNWGCPQVLLGDALICPAGSTTREMVVAIDASRMQDKTVRINGRYGQGMLIVLNGSLEIQGNFTYKGIILVEKDMFIKGGSAGQESKIEGSVISFGASSTVEDNITGTATIKFNRCAINDAQNALNGNALNTALQRRVGQT